MEFAQHVPGFVDQDEEDRVRITFNSLDELMNHPWMVERKSREGFFKYSISRGDTLMAEYKEGREWWVIGYLSGEGIDKLDLPEWQPVEKDKT